MRERRGHFAKGNLFCFLKKADWPIQRTKEKKKKIFLAFSLVPAPFRNPNPHHGRCLVATVAGLGEAASMPGAHRGSVDLVVLSPESRSSKVIPKPCMTVGK